MVKHITGDLYQIGASVSGEGGWREAVRVYVLLNDGRPLLFDAGSHIHSGEIMSDLRSLLGETTPSHIFLTHTELPHTGNLRVILEAWPEVKLVVSSEILPHVELPWWVSEDQVMYGYAGTEEDYSGRHISFLSGILKDQPGTHWMYDGVTGTLFTADAFGYFFPDDADDKCDDELAEGIPVDWFGRYHASAFRFLCYVDSDKVIADIDKVFAKRDVKVIAPTHGNAIRGDIGQCRMRFGEMMREVCR